jgi:hypothetical protein
MIVALGSRKSEAVKFGVNPYSNTIIIVIILPGCLYVENLEGNCVGGVGGGIVKKVYCVKADSSISITAIFSVALMVAVYCAISFLSPLKLLQ